MKTSTVSFEVPGQGCVSGELIQPADARWIYTVSHGVGSDKNHPVLVSLCEGLARHGVASMRYNYPYRERGVTNPLWNSERAQPGKEGHRATQVGRDPKEVLIQTAVEAVRFAASTGLPVIFGGWSLSANVAVAASIGGFLQNRTMGVAVFGFAVFWPGYEEVAEAQLAELRGMSQPLLIIQGGKDQYCQRGPLDAVVDELGEIAAIHWIPGYNHHWSVASSEGKSFEHGVGQVVEALVAWGDRRAALGAESSP